jgi:hypothetical protein
VSTARQVRKKGAGHRRLRNTTTFPGNFFCKLTLINQLRAATRCWLYPTHYTESTNFPTVPPHASHESCRTQDLSYLGDQTSPDRAQWERRRDTVPATLAQLTKCVQSRVKSLQSLRGSTPDRRLPPPLTMDFRVSGNVGKLRSVNWTCYWGKQYV